MRPKSPCLLKIFENEVPNCRIHASRNEQCFASCNNAHKTLSVSETDASKNYKREGKMFMIKNINDDRILHLRMILWLIVSVQVPDILHAS